MTKPLLVLGLCFSLLPNIVRADGLKPGSPAPPIQVGGWVKGNRVTSFKPGNIYVVEFWATWSGPCQEAMPHLSELARKYKGKVTFAGISVFETADNIPPLVRKFVSGMGDKMDYAVAYDTPKGDMAAQWMNSAEPSGVPTAFIVGTDGAVAWIGQPAELDKPLEQVVMGAFDLKASIAQFDRETKEQKAIQSDLERVVELLKLGESGKPSEVLEELNGLIALKNHASRTAKAAKLTLLSRTDSAAFERYLAEMVKEGGPENEHLLSGFAAAVAARASSEKNAERQALAIKVVDATLAINKEPRSDTLYELAVATSLVGSLDRSVPLLERAVASFDADKKNAENEQLKGFRSLLEFKLLADRTALLRKQGKDEDALRLLNDAIAKGSVASAWAREEKFDLLAPDTLAFTRYCREIAKEGKESSLGLLAAYAHKAAREAKEGGADQRLVRGTANIALRFVTPDTLSTPRFLGEAGMAWGELGDNRQATAYLEKALARFDGDKLYAENAAMRPIRAQLQKALELYRRR